MLINNNDVQSINAALIQLQNEIEALQKQINALMARLNNA
jgi:prefoldin subunit 5